MAESAKRSWKQEPLVWLMIGIPAVAVIVGMILLTLAITTYDGLVVDDYYKHGKQINRVLERDRLAHELGLAAALEIDANGELRVRFDPEVSVIPGGNIELALVHSTIPGRDQSLVLTRVENRLLEGRLDLEGEGRWNLYLQTEDWRLTGSLRYPDQDRTRLTPNYEDG
ncbi:MAG: FixH family protein [Gammaproteobacteria bacterium]|nr:FixH family protein [Gammaproteobacteria bacterium]